MAAARSSPLLLGQPLALRRGVELVVGVVVGRLLRRCVDRDEEAGQVPVRRPLEGPEPLVRELVPGRRADQVELERLDEPLAHLDGARRRARPRP